MSFPLLQRYLLKSAVETQDPALQKDMIQMLQHLSPQQQLKKDQEEEVVAPDLNNGLPSQNQQIKGVEDLVLNQAMPEIEKPDPEAPSIFGQLNKPTTKISMLTLIKRAAKMRVKLSAYIKDIKVSQLPPDTKEDVMRFLPNKKVKDPTIVQYGMVWPDLIDRVDPHNFASSMKYVKDKLSKMSPAEYKKARLAFWENDLPKKHILMINDRIVDGHHFLARAKQFGTTNSLNVLDLTPARFQ